MRCNLSEDLDIVSRNSNYLLLELEGQRFNRAFQLSHLRKRAFSVFVRIFDDLADDTFGFIEVLGHWGREGRCGCADSRRNQRSRARRGEWESRHT